MKAQFLNFVHGFHDTTMLLSLALWLCAVPIVLLVVVPFFGWRAGVGAAIVALLLALLVCWGICFYPNSNTEVNANVDRPGLR